MQAIKNKLKDICSHIPRDKPVVYLDYPLHLNFGDILIMRGTEQFFRDYGYRIIARASAINATPDVLSAITPEVTIVFHGGGNFGDLYPLHQNFREDIIKRFPHNKIVVLPQSVHFESPQAAAASAKIFRAHRDLSLLVRDQASYAATLNVFTPKVFLSPDMAHQLWQPAPATPSERAQLPPLYFMRKDKEAAALQHAFNADALQTYDWIDFTPVWQRRVYALILRAHRAEASLGRQLGAYRLWYAFCAFLSRGMTRSFQSYGDVITSRLHGLIFSTLLSKRVHYLDNSYGKLGNYADAWLKDLASVSPVAGGKISP